jgi:hypothetical protein
MLKDLRQVLSNEKNSIYFTPRSPPGAPSLAVRDLKPNKKPVDSDLHLNTATHLPAHKQSRIEGWRNSRADEKLD